MKTDCIYFCLWFGLDWRLERLVEELVFHSDYACAFWSFGHSPILIIIVIFVSCSGPGDNNKSVSVHVLVLWLSVFEIPLLLIFSRWFR